MPRQVRNGNLEKNAQASAESLKSLMQTLFCVALAFNLLLSFSEGGMHYMLLMMRNLQLLLNLPIMNILFPGNVMMVFSIAMPIVMFDVLDNGVEISGKPLKPETIIPFDFP